MWWLPIIGLVLGMVFGIFIPMEIPSIYSHYYAVFLLAILEGVLSGFLEGLRESFDFLSFWTGILVTAFFALLLVYMGEHLSVELYLAVLFALGYKILQSVGCIHLLLVDKFKRGRMEKREK